MANRKTGLWKGGSGGPKSRSKPAMKRKGKPASVLATKGSSGKPKRRQAPKRGY